MGFEPTITNCKFGALINCVIDQGIGYSSFGYRAQTLTNANGKHLFKRFKKLWKSFPNIS